MLVVSNVIELSGDLLIGNKVNRHGTLHNSIGHRHRHGMTVTLMVKGRASGRGAGPVYEKRSGLRTACERSMDFYKHTYNMYIGN